MNTDTSSKIHTTLKNHTDLNSYLDWASTRILIRRILTAGAIKKKKKKKYL